MDNDDDDTIYALSSGSLAGQTATAVAVVRLSGPHAHAILSALTTTTDDTTAAVGVVGLPPTRKAVVRTLYHPVTRSPLDQALVLRFDKPRSFTGEDVVEFHCHGSRAVLTGLLDTLAWFPTTRLAEPGEFTQRAFRAGKLDLLEVEALADLLQADTQTQRHQALQQLEGKLSQLYQNWRTQLTKGLAHAEAVIDFGDDEQVTLQQNDDDDNDDNNSAVWGGVVDQMNGLCQSLESHLQDARRGELVREGLRIAIVGPPNAGKSSLFNILAQRDAAIVSPMEGTTRDVLELSLDLGGVRCTLCDTAGIRRDTNDTIEQVGMERAKAAASQAHVLIAMMDGSTLHDNNNNNNNNPQHGLSTIQDMIETNRPHTDDDDDDDYNNVMLVINKVDLANDDDDDDDDKVYHSLDKFPSNSTFRMSCLTNEGVDEFLEALTQMAVDRVSHPTNNAAVDNNNNEGAIITRARHRQHVQAALQALRRFLQLSQQGTMAVDMAAEELRLATSELGRITGAVDVEDVLNVLFQDFCIGK